MRERIIAPVLTLVENYNLGSKRIKSFQKKLEEKDKLLQNRERVRIEQHFERKVKETWKEN